jgi:hypothetical protein
MTKKKIIIAFAVLLLAVIGLILLSGSKSYDRHEITAEISKDSLGHLGYLGVNASKVKRSYPKVIQSLIVWYRENISSETWETDYQVFGLGGKWITVTMFIKDDRVLSVEIKSEIDAANELKSRLNKKFPGLPCKVIVIPK